MRIISRTCTCNKLPSYLKLSLQQTNKNYVKILYFFLFIMIETFVEKVVQIRKNSRKNKRGYHKKRAPNERNGKLNVRSFFKQRALGKSPLKATLSAKRGYCRRSFLSLRFPFLFYLPTYIFLVFACYLLFLFTFLNKKLMFNTILGVTNKSISVFIHVLQDLVHNLLYLLVWHYMSRVFVRVHDCLKFRSI